uniref:Uncharacterized protein n=1 Tax=Anopheles maculatus TaxID=74869 RepID=A0A182SHY5_9DIPT
VCSFLVSFFPYADKSNSVAHLVENEAPLSTTGNMSIMSGVGGIVGQEDTTTTTVLLDEDGMELETRVIMGGGATPDDSSNKLAGSYTNLFRESLPNGTNGPQPKHNYHHSSMMMSECDKIQSADEIINVSELMMVCSVSGHENVYSNVPPAQISPSGSAVGLLSPKRASVGSSNVSSGVDVPSSTGIGSGGYQHVYSNLLSSSFISNDLDLDDPVLSSSFATAKSTSTMTKMQTPSSANHGGGGGVATTAVQPPQQQQHLKQPQAMITTLEMKNVIKTLDPNVIIQQTSNGTGGGATTSTSLPMSSNSIASNGGPTALNNSSNGESPMFISPSASRMRLLQESTMIDTALDLDSLDGSIGNHSQSCLVKTAIV